MQRRHTANPTFALSLLASLMAGSCIGGGGGGGSSMSPDDEIARGTIAYPFVDETSTLGREEGEEKFIIRSAVGDREYTIEIPGAARDYDVQVPLGDLGESDGDVLGGRKPKSLANPVTTDKEMTAALPRLDTARATDTAIMDSAFGTGAGGGPAQPPSYTLGIAKVNDLFKKRQFEFALVEINALLTFFPNSPQLYKMKGTLLIKMRNLPLAELAWIKVLDLDPNDKAVRSALARLQQRIIASGKAAAGVPLSAPYNPPKPVGTTAPQTEPALQP